MFVENAILLAYAVTIISEEIIVLIIQRPLRFWQWFVAILFINSLTHPLAIYALLVFGLPYILVEISVLLIEWFWYHKALQISWKRSFFLSAVANLCSILLGFIVRWCLNT